MTPKDQPGFDRRAAVDRRRGHDFRPAEERLRQGERRQGVDRRGRGKRSSEGFGHNLLYALAGVVVFCFADIRFFNGQHSMRVAIDWGEYAASTAEHWVGAGFGR
jgi:hypothetical protein